MSTEAINFLNPTTLNIFFGVAGLLGTVFGAVSFIAGRREKKYRDYINKIAERNLDKELSDADLEEKEKEIEARQQQLSELQRQVEHDIPVEARKAVLSDRLHEEISKLLDGRKRIEEIRSELQKLEISNELDHDLASFLEREITPEHILRDKQDRIKTYLTMSTTATAICSFALPYGFRGMVIYPLIAISAYLLYQLFTLHREHDTQFREQIKNNISKATFVFAGLAFAGCILFAFIASETYSRADANIFSGISAGLFGASVFLAVRATILRRREKKITEEAKEEL